MERTKAAPTHHPRGRNLSDEGCLRLRDLLAALLVWGLDLSKPDAARVLGQCPISEDHLRRRLKDCPKNIAAIMANLRDKGVDDVA